MPSWRIRGGYIYEAGEALIMLYREGGVDQLYLLLLAYMVLVWVSHNAVHIINPSFILGSLWGSINQINTGYQYSDRNKPPIFCVFLVNDSAEGNGVMSRTKSESNLLDDSKGETYPIVEYIQMLTRIRVSLAFIVYYYGFVIYHFKYILQCEIIFLKQISNQPV